jgi:hypothetical protein
LVPRSYLVVSLEAVRAHRRKILELAVRHGALNVGPSVRFNVCAAMPAEQ